MTSVTMTSVSESENREGGWGWAAEETKADAAARCFPLDRVRVDDPVDPVDRVDPTRVSVSVRARALSPAILNTEY